MHLTDQKLQIDALKNIREQLLPGGILTFNTFDPWPAMQAEQMATGPDDYSFRLEYINSDGNREKIYNAISYNPYTQQMFGNWKFETYDEEGNVIDERIRPLLMRETYRAEVFLLAELCGFEVLEIGRIDYHDFDYYVNNLECSGDNPNYVEDSTFFCLDEDRDIVVGAVNIRHYLNEALLISGGHIGDGVRPSERGKGVATEMIGLALEECKRLGIYKVLMVCDKDNTASAKSIMNNGGVLENELEFEGVIEQRYWINLISEEAEKLPDIIRHMSMEEVRLLSVHLQDIWSGKCKAEQVPSNGHKPVSGAKRLQKL